MSSFGYDGEADARNRAEGVHESETLPPGLEEEIRRLARGWRRTLEVCERLKKMDRGRPLLELVKD